MNPEAINYNGFTFRVIPKREGITSKRSYTPSIPQSEKPVTEEEMLCAILEREHQMIVQRPDQREIPNITDAQLSKYFLPEHLGIARNAIGVLTQHLRSWSIMPTATDHDTNIKVLRPWRDEMKEKYGDTFYKLYQKNKVRPNGFTSAFGYLSTIPAYIRFTGTGNQPVADLINEIAKKAKELMRTNSKSSYANSDNQTKLRRVRKFDRLVIDTLRILNGNIPKEYTERLDQLTEEALAKANNETDEDPDPLAEAKK